MVVPGPGVLNAAAGLATAYACSSPVLLIAGQIPSRQIGKGLGLLHEIPNQAEVLAGLTKWSARATRPAEIPALVRHAFAMLRSGRPQPVALEIPPDVLAQRESVELRAVPPSEADGVRTPPTATELTLAARRRRDAVHPVIYAGAGVLASGAAAALERVASRRQAPVVVSDNGRGALSDHHPLALTTLAGAPCCLTRTWCWGWGPSSWWPRVSWPWAPRRWWSMRIRGRRPAPGRPPW